MRRIGIIGILSMLLMAFSASVALAQPGTGAHIVGDLTVEESLTEGVTVSGKGAGFGNAVTDAFLTADSVTSTWQCRNPGGNLAPGQGTELANVEGPTDTITPENGNIVFSATLPIPPAPDPEEACPNGNWTIDPEPLSVTYTNVVLHFEQNGEEILTVDLGTIEL